MYDINKEKEEQQDETNNNRRYPWNDTWKRIIEQEKTFDRIIFLGDYHDSFKISSKSIVDNFKSIVELKNSLKDKIILL